MWPGRNAFSAVQKKKFAYISAGRPHSLSPVAVPTLSLLFWRHLKRTQVTLHQPNTNFSLTRKHTSTSRRPSERISIFIKALLMDVCVCCQIACFRPRCALRYARHLTRSPGSQSSHAGRTFPSERKLTVVPAQTRKTHSANKCVSVSGKGFYSDDRAV